MPEKADGYSFTFSDKAKALMGDGNDPMMTALREFGVEQKWPQGKMNTISEALNMLAEKGLVDAGVDDAAELKALGDNGAARRGDADTFLKAMKARGDFDDKQYGEAAILLQTAAGVQVLEILKKGMRDVPSMDPPKEGGGATGKEAAQAKAREMAHDPRYETDRTFRMAADKSWRDAFGS